MPQMNKRTSTYLGKKNKKERVEGSQVRFVLIRVHRTVCDTSLYILSGCRVDLGFRVWDSFA